MAFIGNTVTTQGFTPAIDYFSGNASTTAFTLSRPVASVAQVQAVISNVPQNPGSAFTVSGNTITFTSAPPSGTNNIYVYYTSPITQLNAVGQGTVGTAQLASSSVGVAQLSATGTASSSTYLRGDNTWQAISTQAFPSGTVMLFVQTAAPTGWTKSTTHNDKALRIVSGAASSGGSVAFTTAFASGLSSGATTLSTSQIPAHNHSINGSGIAGSGPGFSGYLAGAYSYSTTTYDTGGGGSHTHTLPSFAVQYVDAIIATAN